MQAGGNSIHSLDAIGAVVGNNKIGGRGKALPNEYPKKKSNQMSHDEMSISEAVLRHKSYERD